MPTLILSPRHTPDSQALWRAATQRGWDVFRLPSWRISDELRSLPEPVLYLEVLMASHVADALGVRCTLPPEDWLCGLPQEYLHRQIRLTTLADAKTCPEPRFVKPPNDKSFQAGVYRGHELPTEYDPSMPVLVADVVHWETEFRCFVLDRRVMTHSIYARDGVPQRDADYAMTENEAEQSAEFAQRVLDDSRVQLPRAAVIDVGIIRNRGWAVVEQNAPWGAGIYACDPDKVLDVLRAQ
jgi:hypothetical protein